MLFRLPAERAQRAGESVLRLPIWGIARPALSVNDQRLKTTIAGVTLPNPLGAAAGVDKDCRFLPSLLDLGFGFAVGGTITLSARPGNPGPRLLRDPQRRALVNALGFPGRGLDAAEARLGRLQRRRGRIMASISGTVEDEIVECHLRLQRLVAAVEVNISSPNTAGLRAFHEPARLRGLLEALVSRRSVPLFVKLPPWTCDEERAVTLTLAETAADANVDGLIVANTRPINHAGLAMGRGGLSGAPLFDSTVKMVAAARAAISDEVAIIACGGVSSAEHVWQLISVGASAVQLYTSLVYEGPGLPGRINRGLVRLMARAGLRNLAEIRGASMLAPR